MVLKVNILVMHIILSFMAAGVFVRWGSGLCPDTAKPVQPGM